MCLMNAAFSNTIMTSNFICDRGVTCSSENISCNELFDLQNPAEQLKVYRVIILAMLIKSQSMEKL